MKGIQSIKVSNRYAQYKFELYRNLTIVRGDSGTGKTTLYNMIADYTRDKEKSGVNLSSTSPCVALTDSDWKNQLSHIQNSIVFIDEDSKYITSLDFAKAAKNSDNYYVIISREDLHNLLYSVNEIYEIKTSGKYHTLKKRYLLTEKSELKIKKTKGKFSGTIILTEDSKSGYQFFDAVAKASDLRCDFSGSNAAIFSWLKAHPKENAIVICDGAAFGAEIGRVSQLIGNTGNIRLLLPESFEWVILKSGLIENVKDVLENPSAYIECSDHFSWENFFTDFLVEKTKGTYLAYSKARLKENYLHETEKTAILSVLPEI